jgi:hypothetical protein
MSDAFKKKVDELRHTLMGDLPQQELQNMQLKVDTLLKLAIMDAGHDHDTQGGVGHHDHSALADLSWRLEGQRAVDIEKKQG